MKTVFTICCLWVTLLSSGGVFAGPYTTVVKETESTLTVSTIIKASPKKIWDVMVDFKNYGLWNIYTIDGEAKKGATVQMHSKGFTDSWLIDHLDLKIYKLVENQTLCWIDVSNFTYLGAGGFRCRTIKPLADDRVLFVNHFEYTGIFWRLLKWKTYDDLKKGLKDENEALKRCIEPTPAA